MHHLFASHGLFDLFIRHVRAGKPSEVRKVVSEVARDLKELGPVELQDPSTHTRRQRQVEILQAGLERLCGSARNQAEETAAITRDEERFQKPLSRVSTPQETQYAPIVVHDMQNPGRSFTLPKFSKCKHVRLYLQKKELAKRPPELWVRHRDSTRQPHTPNGLYWEWLGTDAPVQNKYLEFISRESPCEYIVALKYVISPVAEEVPEVIDLPPNGGPCCTPECEHLWNHLDAIWPNERVREARKIDGQDDCGILFQKFDALSFDHRTNNLIVKVELRGM